VERTKPAAATESGARGRGNAVGLTSMTVFLMEYCVDVITVKSPYTARASSE